MRVSGWMPNLHFMICGDNKFVNCCSKLQVSLCPQTEKYRAMLPYTAPVCSQFVGRSEHTCGPTAQQAVDRSAILIYFDLCCHFIIFGKKVHWYEEFGFLCFTFIYVAENTILCCSVMQCHLMQLSISFYDF